MSLRLADRWLWDFWTVRDGDDIHAFYLQAPRALGDPELRHQNASIGHAVTRDLEAWEVLPDAFGPGEPGAFDDQTTWTGSVIEHDGVWHMLYTGTSSADGGLVQRIGLATSRDLTTWTRSTEPVLEADARWYEQLDLDAWFDLAFRDPWVFRDPHDDGLFHVYLTARSPAGDPLARAVIGHARSRDLLHWEPLEPVTEPMGFGQMEVPQLVNTGDTWHLLFSSDPGTRRPDLDVAGAGTYCLSGPSAFGPFEPSTLATIEADPHRATYAGKLIELHGDLFFVAWLGREGGGDFSGTLSRPRRVAVGADGRLHLET